MPLVRIDVQEGRSPAQLRRLADVVQEVMLEVFARGSTRTARINWPKMGRV